MKPKSTHRYRVCGTPSKLGCITCKVRRVKCGEEKPYCKRCTSTGRKCDGYEPPPASNTPSRQKTSPPLVLRKSSEDDMEQQYLETFRAYMAPQSSGNITSDFWERRVLQFGHVEPSIRHAMVAIAAIQQGFEVRQHCSGDLQAFAFRQYTKAISCLHKLMSEQTQPSSITLVACILFICFDSIRGNLASAVMHLKAGLKILEHMKDRNPDEEAQLAPPLLSCGLHVANFISPKVSGEREAVWSALVKAGRPPQPTNFQTLDDARYSLDLLCASIICDRIKANVDIFEDEPPLSENFNARRYAPDLQTWSDALERMLSDYSETEPPTCRISRCSLLLKTRALVLSIMVGIPHESHAKFEKLLTLCDYLIAANASLYGTTFLLLSGQGIIAPLFFAAWRGSTLAVKQRALDLLSQCPGREGLWDAANIHRMAEDHLKNLQSGQSASTRKLPGSISPAAAKIWNEIGRSFKDGMTWNLESSQTNEAELQFIDTLRPTMPP